MDILIIIVLIVVALLLVWNIAQRRRHQRETQLQDQSESALEAILAALDRDQQARELQAEALSARTATAAAAEAARMAKAELETQARSSAELVSQQQQTFDRTAQQIGVRMERMQRDLASRQGNWSEQFGQVNETLAKLGGTTESLTHMLSSPGQKGSWGEKVAEDILRAMGMKEGLSYEVRKRLPGGEIPDFSFSLPKGQLLCMDSKLPFDSYRSYREAPEAEKEKHRREFLRAVRGHVKALSAKSYGDAGMVLMFIPLESIYAFIWESDAGLLDFAFENGVMLCSPSNLFAVLTLVREANAAFALEKAGDEVLEIFNLVKREWMDTQKVIEVLRTHIKNADKKVDEITGKRYQAMDRVFDQIDSVRSDRGMAPTDEVAPGQTVPLIKVI
ncbi:MAG: DNA recombination protein RmuC [bacterium]|nr:DNA recombination protein RmuC [bacterium]MDE0602209.1 DNA recombination protein RmuC [bacterium]